MDAPKRSPKKPLIIVSIVVAVFGLVYFGYRLITAGEETTDDAQIVADVIPLAARVPGQIAKVLVEENQLVKAGQVLIELDTADFEARVRQAEADLAVAKAQADGADAQVSVVSATSKGGLVSARAAVSGSSVGVGTAEAQLTSAKAGLLRAEAEAKKAESDLARAKDLKAAKAISEQRYDDAERAHESTQAGLAQAKAQVAIAEEARHAAGARVEEAQGHLNQSSEIDAQIATAKANADLAHARMASAAAMLDLARLQLSYTKVAAPEDGLASKLSVKAGQLVAAGQPLTQLVTAKTYVVANFKETQIGNMQLGQEAEVKIDAFPGKKLEGKVESLSGGTGASFSLIPADNATGNFVKVVQRVPVRIEWSRPPEMSALKNGLSAEVTVYVK